MSSVTFFIVLCSDFKDSSEGISSVKVNLSPSKKRFQNLFKKE